MKKFIVILFLALYAQLGLSQECSTSWPYLYKDFTDGIIYKKSGGKVYNKLNVHVLKGRLHYIENEMVKEAVGNDILLIEIGKDKYMPVNGDIMKIVGQKDNGFVTLLQTADMQRLTETGGAYGTSSTSSSTRKITSIDMTAADIKHTEMLQNRSNGTSIDLNSKYYIVAGENVYEASKKTIENELPAEDKDAFRSFVKDHRIKWKNADSLTELLDFFKTEK